MNWSHALLVVAIIGAIATWMSLFAYQENDKTLHWIFVISFFVTVISGALAAGLWR